MASSQDAACDLAGRLTLEGAVLDIDPRGRPVYPVAEALRGRDVPFVFLTGYSHAAIPAPWRGVQLIEKPFNGGVLVEALRLAMAGEPADPLQSRMTTPAIRRACDRVRQTRDILTAQRAWAEEHGFAKPPPR